MILKLTYSDKNTFFAGPKSPEQFNDMCKTLYQYMVEIQSLVKQPQSARHTINGAMLILGCLLSPLESIEELDDEQTASE